MEQTKRMWTETCEETGQEESPAQRLTAETLTRPTKAEVHEQ